ncbi:MAG: ABC transporter ATP-binding protein, partial [Cellulomonas sp.]|nr:ABC transporter ATP-binding protein [Cellulomonas sp.]
TDGTVVAQGSPHDLGGRTSHRALVRWNEDDVVRERATDSPTRVVAELAARFAAAGQDEVPGLQVLRPSLEDVYLQLIGAEQATGTTTIEEVRR